MHAPTVDVLVLGAGPAGCAAAIDLCRRGRSVAVFERDAKPRLKIGEHLRPEAALELRELELDSADLTSCLRASPGVRVAWGSSDLRERDYLFDPSGSAHNSQRRELEAALAARAERAGAPMVRGVSKLRVERRSDGDWLVTARARNGSVERCARWLLDATGRSAWLARQLGARRERIDRQVALSARWRPKHSVEDGDRLLVEAAPDGWWYSLVLPDGAFSAVYLTDGDLLAHRGSALARGWTSALAHAPHTQQRVQRAGGRGPVRTHAADTSLLTPSWGAGWVAVGDAEWSSDPLAGLGVSQALQSGRSAAQALDAVLIDPAANALHARETLLRQRIDAHLEQWLATYRQETRWLERPYWSRRHAAPARIAPIALLPDDEVLLSPATARRPALGLTREQITSLLALAPTPRPAAQVAREFMLNCAVEGPLALRALQAFAQVVDRPRDGRSRGKAIAASEARIATAAPARVPLAEV